MRLFSARLFGTAPRLHVVLAFFVLSILVVPRAPSAEDGGQGAAEVRSIVAQAVSVERAGDFRGALALYEQALGMAAAKSGLPRAFVLRHRGIAWRNQAASEEAAADLREAARLYEEGGDDVSAAQCRLRLVPILDERGDAAAAAALLTGAERVFREHGDERSLRLATLFRVRRLIAQERPADALGPLEKLERAFREHGQNDHLIDVLSLRAYALQQLGEWQRARDVYQALLTEAFRLDRQQSIAYAYCNLGEVERALGAPEVAQASLDRAISGLDRLRSSVAGGARERVRFLDLQADAYGRKIALLVDQGGVAAALRYAERFHGRGFLEEAHDLRVRRRLLDESADGEEQAQFERLMALQRRLITGQLTAEESERLNTVQAVWLALTRKRRREEEVQPKPIEAASVAAIRAALAPRSAMVIYWVAPRRTFVWVIHHGGLELLQVPVTRDRLAALLERWTGPLRSRDSALDVEIEGRSHDHLAAGHELFRLLMAPVLRRVNGIETLVISPDGPLWRLPFGSLVTRLPGAPAAEHGPAPPVLFERYARAAYLVSEIALSYTPSATVWLDLHRRRPAAGGLLAAAPGLENSALARAREWRLPPLPGARAEVEAIAALTPDSRSLLSRAATESAVKRAVGDARFVHFATHGRLQADRPDLSALLFWPETKGDRVLEDGLLQSFEVRGLPWHAELVSLAVCDSARGQPSRSEGTFGLARSLLLGGARNVAVSLWPVDDRAGASIYVHLYHEALSGVALPLALQRAQKQLLVRTRRDASLAAGGRVTLAHPYFWAGHVLLGGS